MKVQKAISLEPEQLDWIKDNCINISKLVRKNIDKLMKGECKDERRQVFGKQES